jgi:CHAT domain-containing protein
LEDSLSKTLSTLEKQRNALLEAAQHDSTYTARKKLEDTQRQLHEAAATWEEFKYRLSRKYPLSEGCPYTLDRVQAQLDNSTAIVGWLDFSYERINYESWGYVIRNSGPVTWVKLKTAEEDSATSPEERTDAYREVLKSKLSSTSVVKTTAHSVWTERFLPLVDALDGIENLVVIPSGPMLGIPVETLIDDDGVFLGDRYAVSYTPSATIYTWLAEKEVGKKRLARSALLLGDPPFNESHALEMEKEAEEEDLMVAEAGSFDPDHVRSALAGNDELLQTLPRLSYTRREVRHIASYCPKPTVLVGKDATEQELVRLAEADELKQYSIIHLATHALVDDEQPERSALILSRVGLPDAFEAALAGQRIYDGLVTAKEIVHEWNLDADLVTLSACETGLGKEVAGEGYIGFAHAFLQAGARSLIVSLWRVPDQATSLLMQRFYRNRSGAYKSKSTARRHTVMSKAEALQEAKKWLREYADDYGERPYEHPYFWSGFVLMGAQK